MKPTSLLSILCISTLVARSSLAGLADVQGIWQLDNSLDEEGGGAALAANGFVPVYAMSDVGGQMAAVLDLPALDPAQTLALTNNTGPNGAPGAASTNNWTLVMDVNLETIGTFQSLVQTDPGNANDQDLFVRPGGALGTIDFGPNVSEPGAVGENQWYRLAFSCGNDGNGGALQCIAFVDGVQTTIGGVPQVANNGFDGQFSLGSIVNLFSDESSETDDMLVNSIAFWGEALSAAEVAALGSATAAGIEIPQNPKLCPAELACTSRIDPAQVELDWTPGSNLDTSGIEVMRDGGVIATLASGASSHVDNPTLPAGSEPVTYDYVVRVTGNDSGLCAPLTCSVTFYTGDIADESVLHLPLDADGSDISGLGNDGAVGGVPMFASGQIANAPTFDNNAVPAQLVSVAPSASLSFGDDTDFTVSVWVNNGNGFATDPAIISNKDWGAGGNVGWLIAAGPDGRWQWNMSAGAGRVDYDGAAGQISDGNWHHLLVSHDRDGEAVMYYDGREAARRDISGIGDVDSGLPIAVANDGTLVYPGFPGSIDDVVIWRRMLAPSEVLHVFDLGTDNRTITHPEIPKICPSGLTVAISSSDPVSVDLSWLVAQNLDSTGIEVLFRDAVIATLVPGATTFSHMPDLSGDSGLVELEYAIRMVGGADSAGCTPVPATKLVNLGSLIDGLVLYLPLEGSSQDFSGRNNHGTINGVPLFGAGQIDQAITLSDPADPHQFINVGTPADLDFGADTDFSVSVWVNNLGGFPDNSGAGGSNDDPSIISNKDWNSGNNSGWLISGGGNGRWQWNIGDGSARRDYDGPGGQIDDGAWHHLCVVHDRDGLATLYYDGTLVASIDISPIGTIDAGLSTAVGTDGTLGTVWANWFPGSIDEVAIWHRRILPSEIADVFAAGTAGTPLINTELELEITDIQFVPPDQVTLTFNGNIGVNYLVFGSDDLALWNEITDNAPGAGAGSVIQFTDIDSAFPAPRFYQLRDGE